MVDRLKGALKTELAALRGDGSDGGEANATPKKSAATPRKRKAVGAKDVDGTPSKKGRKKKEVDEELSQEGGEDEVAGKAGVKEEEEFVGV